MGSTAGATVLTLPAVANLGAAAGLASSLQAQLQVGSGRVHVDASGLQVYDTSTVALLMQLRRLAERAGRGFELQAAPAQLVQLARLYGVDELLGTPAEG